jgi:hypothetical protein
MVEISEEGWDSTLAELLALKMIVAGLLEQAAKQTPDPAEFLAAIHTRVIADIQQSRFKGHDKERDAAMRERMQERVDGLLSAMTARVLSDK